MTAAEQILANVAARQREMQALRDSAVIIWTDYGLEGWKPQGFVSTDAAVAAILNGETYGPIIVTYPYPMDLRKQLGREE